MNNLSSRSLRKERRAPLAIGPSLVRRALGGIILSVCLVVMIHVWLLEAFVVPTGSMAPVLAGHHRAATCPCCGHTVRVGRHPNDGEGNAGNECYREASCPNCGHGPLLLGNVREAQGDHILVNKSVFVFRRPRRWEVVVFKLFGKIFVKRIVGLPGEWLTIVDGDVFVNDRLVHKTLAEFKAARILLFDNNFLPEPRGGSYCWEYEASPRLQIADCRLQIAGPAPFQICNLQSAICNRDNLPYDISKDLLLDGSHCPDRRHWLSFRHFSMKTGKDEPIHDEYAYNGGFPRGEAAVRDFMLDGDLEVMQGTGTALLAISDGGDTMVLELPVGQQGEARLYRQQGSELPPRECQGPAVAQRMVELTAGRTYHLELALVDRRLTATINGREIFQPLDLAAAAKRHKVDRPVSLGVRGATARFRNVRLYRDVHYTQAGHNAVRGNVVRLGADQYFVMGDNSPNSEDSRFWPNQGAVPGQNLVGKVFAVHLPSRVLVGHVWNVLWHCQAPDWERVHWLR